MGVVVVVVVLCCVVVVCCFVAVVCFCCCCCLLLLFCCCCCLLFCCCYVVLLFVIAILQLQRRKKNYNYKLVVFPRPAFVCRRSVSWFVIRDSWFTICPIVIRVLGMLDLVNFTTWGAPLSANRNVFFVRQTTKQNMTSDQKVIFATTQWAN